MLWRRFRRLDGAMQGVVIGAAVSVALWIFVLAGGFQSQPDFPPQNYRPYFSIHNWWPYPLFFLVLALPLYLTWEPMLRAWRKLTFTGVLKRGREPADEADVDAVIQQIRALRRYAIAAAALFALFVGTLDAATFFPVYSGAASAGAQVEFACAERNAFAKWLFEVQPLDCRQPEKHTGPGSAPPLGQIALLSFTSLQQLAIVFLAALGVTQLLLHTSLFALFEGLPVSRARGLRLELNASSAINEFGLEHWNHALNNFYWAVSPAFVPAFFSRSTADPEDYLPGQELLGIAVPAALIAPLVATIITRQLRLPALWDALQSGKLDAESYRRQALWPLDRNWAAKLGILLSFVLAGLALGVNLARLVAL